MTTAELIKLLQEIDPEGNTHVSIGNKDILFVDTEPAYWDGCLQILIKDKKLSPYYDVIGAKYISEGSKVVIHPLSIKEAIWDDPDMPVEYDEYSEKKHKNKIEDERKEAKKCEVASDEKRRKRNEKNQADNNGDA